MERPRSVLWIGSGPTFRHLSDRLAPEFELLQLTLSPHSLASLVSPFGMEAIASLLSAKIRNSGIPGPYLLGGWSLEALMAYETARRLVADGSSVALVVLLDPPNLGMGPTPPVRKILGRLRRELFHLSRLRHMTFPEARRYLLGRFDWWKVRLQRRKWTDAEGADSKGMMTWEQALWLAAGNYRVCPWDGRVCLLQAEFQSADPSWNPSASWPRRVKNLETFVVPGDHTTVFEEPNVTALADAIRASIAKLTITQV